MRVEGAERVRRSGWLTCRINEWHGRSSPQLSIRDIRKIDRHEHQAVFPTEDTDSPVKLIDRRHTDKKAYLSTLLEQEEPIVFYVRDEKAINPMLGLYRSANRIDR